ncbi:MAG: hypothetical protein ACP5T2_05000 [Thermoprotei archaeon]
MSNPILFEERAAFKARVDRYVTASLYLIAVLLSGFVLPLAPVGGFFVLPVVLGLALVLLSLRRNERSAKLVAVYYMIMTVIVQGFFALAPLASAHPNLLLAQLSLFLVYVLVGAPEIASSSSLVVLGGWVAGVLLIYPNGLPFALAAYALVAVYSRDVGRTAGAVAVSMVVAEPFVVASAVLNGGAGMAFVALRLNYLRVDPASASFLLNGDLSSLPAYSVIGSFVRSPLKQPVYLMGTVKDLGSELAAVSSVSGYVFSKIAPANARDIVAGLLSILVFFYRYLAAALMLMAALMFAVEAMNLAFKFLETVEAQKAARYLSAAEPVAYGVVLSSLALLLVGQAAVPFDFSTSVSFGPAFLVGTLGVVIAASSGISVEELYATRVDEAERLRKEIGRMSDEFEAKRSEILSTLNKVKGVVKEREFAFEGAVSSLEAEEKEAASGLEKASLELLRQRAQELTTLLDQLTGLKARLTDEVTAQVRASVLAYNRVASEAERLLGLSVNQLSEESYSSLEALLEHYGRAYGVFADLSKALSEKYASLSSALSALFPDEVSAAEPPPPSPFVEGLENQMDFYVKPLLEGKEEDYEKYEKEISQLTGISGEYPIGAADEFLKEVGKWVSGEQQKLQAYLEMVSSLDQTLSGVLELDPSYAPLRGSASAVPLIQQELKALNDWRGAEGLLSAISGYKEALPQIERAMKVDMLQVEILSVYKVIEAFAISSLRSRELSPEDFPLSHEAAVAVMQLMPRLRPAEFELEVRSSAYGEKKMKLRRRGGKEGEKEGPGVGEVRKRGGGKGEDNIGRKPRFHV